MPLLECKPGTYLHADNHAFFKTSVSYLHELKLQRMTRFVADGQAKGGSDS